MPINGTNLNQTPSGKANEVYRLRLYIAGTSARSMKAISSIKHMCDEYLLNRYVLEVVDLNRQHVVDTADGFIVAPMLVRHFPLPVRKLVNDLTNTKEMLRRLDITDDVTSLPQ
jgi:circadian clock protein KaiB